MTIPNGFCVLPFTQYSTYNTKDYRLCCMAKDPKIPISQKNKSINEIWNSDYLKTVRKTMIAGEWHKDCITCKNLEDSGITSSRNYENMQKNRFIQNIISKSKKNNYISEQPIDFDFRLGNLCNLHCQMCTHHASHLVSVERAQMLQNKTIDLSTNKFLNNEDWLENQIDKKLALLENGIDWENFLPLLPNVRSIKVIGGEPTVNADMFRLIDECISSDNAKKISLKFYTNMTNLNQNWLEKLKNFKHVVISCSLEGYGKMNDYLRPPSNWEHIWNNFDELVKFSHNAERKSIRVRVTTVNQIINSLHLADFFRFLYEYCKNNNYNLGISSNQLSAPLYYSIRFSPDWIIQEQKKQLEDLWKEIQKDNIRDLVLDFRDAIQDVILFGKNSKYDPAKMKQFIYVTEAYDIHRKDNILDVFPEFEKIKKDLNYFKSL